MFLGRKLFIATKHKKETVIAPIIEVALGVVCFTNLDFDTDILGTFCGEIETQIHVIEHCPRARRLWELVNPTELDDPQGITRNLLSLGGGGAVWSLEWSVSGTC